LLLTRRAGCPRSMNPCPAVPVFYVAGSLRLCLKPSQESETTTPDKSRLTFTYINIFVYTSGIALLYQKKQPLC
jgi:hypothetical protein